MYGLTVIELRRLVMSQKKKQEEETIPLLGRFSTQLKMGIVGLPNVGYGTTYQEIVIIQCADARMRSGRELPVLH